MKLGQRFGLLFLCISVEAVAQDLVPIVDASQTSSPSAQDVVTEFMPVESTRSVEPVPSRYDIMQNLREEVRMLRGLVEEMAYELQQVKQRQLDDYLDLDRRLGLAQETGISLVSDSDHITDNLDITAGDESTVISGLDATTEVEFTTVAATVQADIVLDKSSVEEDYKAASNKLLKGRDIEGATIALKIHLERYPTSEFAANANYWLGEIYLLQGDTELARQAFTSIVERHANHPKAMDSSFKLGKIYFQLGELKRAKSLLEDAAQSSGGVASKARNFLDKNF
jgi:TolA-binding protein|tara:strand:- start:220 stop:1071 length:852 start_codon:yes stop_codon:yes gene_type:complete